MGTVDHEADRRDAGGRRPRGRGRPPGGRPVVDREALLDAAERVIAREGNGASLEAIAVEAGVTKPIVYARIGDRADLSDALAARLADRLIREAGTEIDPGHIDRPTLASFVRRTLEVVAEHRELFLYVTRGSTDDGAQRTLHLADRSAAPLAAVLRGWRVHHGTDPAVAETWAYALVGMLNLVSLWSLEQERPVGVLADELAELLWSGLGPSGDAARRRGGRDG